MMTSLDIAHLRLHNQQISRQMLEKPVDIVTWMGAMQAQDFNGAKWSIGLRLPHVTDADIDQAIADKTIVRTWPLRGTLHFVPAVDVRWMLQLAAPRTIASSARRYRELELDEKTLTRSNTLLANALHDGSQLNRTELLAKLEQNGISTKGQRGIYMLQRASLDGLICQGLMYRINNPYFMSIDTLPQTPKTFERDEALAELTRRYFTSHGPATLQDFVWWSGLLTRDARDGLEAVRTQITREEIDGTTYYWMPQDVTSPINDTPGLHLLPGFDEYLLGYRDRAAVLNLQHATRIVPGGNGMFLPTIVARGQVVGTWKRVIKKRVVVLSPSPFATLSTKEREALATAAENYGDYLGMPVTVSEI